VPLFWARFYMYSFLYKFHFRFPDNFSFLKPGLEIKFALEEAEKLGAKTYFLGGEFNGKTWNRLFHETRMNLPQYIFKKMQYATYVFWEDERIETRAKLHNSEPA